MAWYVYLAYFVAGLFLANGVPHFVQGISGNKFAGWSAVVNAAFGLVNFAIGFVLIRFVGVFTRSLNLNVLVVFLGALVMSLVLAWYFARARKN